MNKDKLIDEFEDAFNEILEEQVSNLLEKYPSLKLQEYELREKMKEELKSSIKNTIKENTLDSQALSDAQKVESSKNKLEELKSFVTKNAIDIYENEEKSNDVNM